MQIRLVILSGGSGTRLWPLSRKDYPKQFAQLVGGQSLLAAALQMLQASGLFLPPLIIANEGHKFFILDMLEHQPWQGADIILEPCGRNTAAAALTAALAEQDGTVLHLLMPSDHQIADAPAFFTAVAAAKAAAAENHIALFGIKPAYAETGYGYILRGRPTVWPQVEAIKSFQEKPDKQTAERLIADGALWNSGIFLYHPATLVKEIERTAPQDIAFCRQALGAAARDLGCRILDHTAYAKLQDISFDHRVMENTSRGAVVPCDMGWGDIGSWQALWQSGAKDEDGNVIQGAIAAIDTCGSYIRSESQTVGVIGCEDMTIVATKDAVLVAPRHRSQDVKNLVAKLAARNHKAAATHHRTLRPWGSYEGVADGNRFQVKHIVVKPGQTLSLQMHYHRAEHWVVVAGTAQVECDGVDKRVHENESIFIPKGAKHRLSNPGKLDLHVVEVQSGEYLGEDDIVRYSDDYGRVG